MNTPVIRLCPICRKPRVEEHTPFCSTRCRDRDLLRWLDDGYALPISPTEPDPED
ncbi:DNA gyrase inhibitor YacG [Novosphingobium sp.]|uniref:DNA gyrase inhibitor YacG n=1 Tax=Novosphingobium sp. TaxID=1874826 RepID=UPI00260D1EE1|nr:DNA gyrase inhibitor YacG [Novosphingobium sp.]